MSNRTLIEINHDFFWEISGAANEFSKDVTTFLQNPWSPTNIAMMWDNYHIKVFGTRHSDDGYVVKWGHKEEVRYEPK